MSFETTVHARKRGKSKSKQPESESPEPESESDSQADMPSQKKKVRGRKRGKIKSKQPESESPEPVSESNSQAGMPSQKKKVRGRKRGKSKSKQPESGSLEPESESDSQAGMPSQKKKVRGRKRGKMMLKQPKSKSEPEPESESDWEASMPSQKKKVQERKRRKMKSESDSQVGMLRVRGNTQTQPELRSKSKKSANVEEEAVTSRSQPVRKRPKQLDDTELTQQGRPALNRSNLQSVIKLLKDTELSPQHVASLKKTPFWLLIQAIVDEKLVSDRCRKFDGVVVKVIKSYQEGTRSFRLGDKNVELTRDDVKLIFGISCGDENMVDRNMKKEETELAQRLQIKEARLSTTTIRQKIKELKGSKEQQDIDDIARLLCLFLCVTLFFSTTGTTANWCHVRYLDNLENVKKYDWTGAIRNYLLKSIHRNHRDLKDLKGCSVLLPVNHAKLKQTAKERNIYSIEIEKVVGEQELPVHDEGEMPVDNEIPDGNEDELPVEQGDEGMTGVEQHEVGGEEYVEKGTGTVPINDETEEKGDELPVEGVKHLNTPMHGSFEPNFGSCKGTTDDEVVLGGEQHKDGEEIWVWIGKGAMPINDDRKDVEQHEVDEEKWYGLR
ncbi:hypothetical protein RHGRI_001763 [Rhododendron griersonianum]|uniref:DUF1985 domain-containing protein n=1 Tax=Rhododendron griersonianum TaxID=479676 RepID=A0AAV6LLB4_9ERIC|nr:hypothetical protein RHGRI_001763 [Rhododendron griersonianum]